MKRRIQWNRMLWGIVRSGKFQDSEMLIGNLWDPRYFMRGGFDDEPTRALLFQTRAAARKWCTENNGGEGVFHVVRVRETVKLA